MKRILTWIKQNKVIVIMFAFFAFGGITTAILTTCLPSYTISKISITDGPTTVLGNAQTSGESDQTFQFLIEGDSKNGGKTPTPNFVILMTGSQTLPSWLSISDDKVKWTSASEVGVYTFILQIKVDSVESLAPFTTTLTIS